MDANLYKVKLLTTLAGPQGCHTPGALLDLPVDQARQFVKRGFAVWVGQPPTEESTAPQVEQTAAALFRPPTESATPPINVRQQRRTIGPVKP